MQTSSQRSERQTCAECPAQAKVGSRCIHCYVTRYARRLGLNQYKWFKAHREKFELTLAGRLTTIEEGFEPASPSVLIRVFLASDPRIRHSGGPGRKHKIAQKPVQMLLALIEDADSHARRNNGSTA